MVAEGGGTGLGLTIAKMLTDLMGGEMTVSTTLGQGTLFRVRLFLPALHGVRVPAAAPPRGGYAGPRRRLLVVDNEEVDRTLLARRLQGLGFDVLEAGSGQAALALLQEAAASAGGAATDAILMDLAMPGIDGWQTIRTLRAPGPERRAGGHRLGQCLRQGPGQRRRHHAGRLHHQARALG